MQRFSRRQALAGGASLLAGLTLGGQPPVSAQLTGRPAFVMFHVEAGW